MKIGDRLKEERERLGLSQIEFAALGAASKRSQIDWEKGTTTPNALFLAAAAAAGVDVRYVVTGERDYEPPPPLAADEHALINAYRKAPSIGKEFIRRCAGVPLGAGEPAVGQHEFSYQQIQPARRAADTPAAAADSSRDSVVIHGDVGQHIKGVINGPNTVVMGAKKPRK